MILINPATAIMLYLAMTLVVLLTVWILSHYKRKKRKIFQIEKELFVCEYCHSTYVDDHAKKVTRCPQCQSFNEQNTYQALKSKTRVRLE